MGHYSFNHGLGIVNNSILTVALIGSVGLLVAHLPSHKEAPLRLLLFRAELSLTNVLVFALWYWRLDGGGPTVREQHPGLREPQFCLPPNANRTCRTDAMARRTLAAEFCRLPVYRLYAKLHLRPNRCPAARALGQAAGNGANFHLVSIVILLIARAVGGL